MNVGGDVEKGGDPNAGGNGEHDGDPKPDGADDSGVAGNTDGEKVWGEVDSMDEETL